MSRLEIRITPSLAKILRVFLERPLEWHSGAEISRIANVGSGALYPLLVRLETLRWLSSEWEKNDPGGTERSRRRCYRITALGQRNAADALAELQQPDLEVIPGVPT